MNTIRAIPFALAALLAIGAAGSAAHAEDRDGNQNRRDAAALANMRVTLPQTITTAEQQVAGGRAVGADVSQEGGGTRIAVEVVGPQGVRTVLVDAQTGQVTATRDGGEDND